LQQRCTGY